MRIRRGPDTASSNGLGVRRIELGGRVRVGQADWVRFIDDAMP